MNRAISKMLLTRERLGKKHKCFAWPENPSCRLRTDVPGWEMSKIAAKRAKAGVACFS